MGAGQSIAELSNEAHRANDAGLYSEARRSFLEIVKLEPQRNAARVSAANMAMKAGNAELALGELNALLARRDLSQACIVVAKKNQAAAAEVVAMARAQRLENFSPVSPKRLERQAPQLSERSPQPSPRTPESIDHRLARQASEQKDAEARPRRWFFLAAVVLVACLAYAIQTEMLTLPTFTPGLVGDTLSTTAGSESKARGGKRNGGASRLRSPPTPAPPPVPPPPPSPPSPPPPIWAASRWPRRRHGAKPQATAVPEVNLRSHLLGLSEYFAIASSSAIAHLPSEFTELFPPGQLGLVTALALSAILMLGYCVLLSTARAARGRSVTKGGATDYAATLAGVVSDLSYDSPTPEHLWYHPVRLASHPRLPARLYPPCVDARCLRLSRAALQHENTHTKGTHSLFRLPRPCAHRRPRAGQPLDGPLHAT